MSNKSYSKHRSGGASGRVTSKTSKDEGEIYDWADGLTGNQKLSTSEEFNPKNAEDEELIYDWVMDSVNNMDSEKRDRLEAIIDENPKYKGDTYRALRLEDDEIDSLNRLLGGGSKKIYTPNRLQSWSTTMDNVTDMQRMAGKDFLNTVFVCHGYQNGLNISNYNQYQTEVISSRKTKYRLKYRYVKDGVNYYHMEVVS